MLLRRLIIPLCLLILLVPVYLWKVQGWWTASVSGQDPLPAQPFDPSKAIAEFNPLDVSDANRGIIAGAAINPIDNIELLARTDVIELLRQSLVKCQETANNYTCTLAKQERINGKLNTPEEIEVWFKQQPFSVFMHWKKNVTPAAASLYVQGENKGKILVRPSAAAAKIFGYVERPVDAADVKATTRYLVTEFGLRCGTERTYKAWKELRDKGNFNTTYLGLRKKVEEAGGRDCHVILRKCDPPEEDGMTEITIYIDAETWFQVGSILKAKDDLVGSYWFRDINLNPSFDAKQFLPETLKKY
ncbi:MAG: DUF1571 domain-containing protein [Planctomycetes bacterium]|nr:DUF1571 domain-containing protein [Planctomycetota bacterium]